MVAGGLARPVLVGGAAVELYTRSAITTRDFDVVTPWQEEFEDELRQLGLTKPGGLCHTPLGWVHPTLQLGFEVVSSRLHDGLAERDRVVMIDLTPDDQAAFISLKDIVADRNSRRNNYSCR